MELVKSYEMAFANDFHHKFRRQNCQVLLLSTWWIRSAKKKRRGPDNYCLILFVGDRSIIYPVSLKMVWFSPPHCGKKKTQQSWTSVHIRSYPYMMKPSCWVLQTVHFFENLGDPLTPEASKNATHTPWRHHGHHVLQICQGDALGSATHQRGWRIMKDFPNLATGKLTSLWKITMFNGKIHYFNGHVQ